MMTRRSGPPAHLGRCHCGADVDGESFRDRQSYLEFHITGWCQQCQDGIYLTTCAHDPSHRFTLRHGAVAVHDAQRDEYCLLPLLFTAAPRIAWEARFILRIGARLQPLDPHVSLAPMAEALSDHAVRVHESATIRDPAMPVRLACTDLVIVLDHPTREALQSLPLPSTPRVVVLADAARWSEHYGASVPDLERAWGAEPESHRSTLRTCALVGWALTHIRDDDILHPMFDSILTACADD